jgi:hypothetical protein
MDQPRIVLIGGPNKPSGGPGILARILIAAVAVGIVGVAFFFAFFLAVIAGLAILLLLLRFWFRRWWYGRKYGGGAATASTAADGTRTWQWNNHGDSGFLKISMHTSVTPSPARAARADQAIESDDSGRVRVIDVSPDQN